MGTPRWFHRPAGRRHDGLPAAVRQAEGLPRMKVGVFLHGTAIMHAAAAGVEVIRQHGFPVHGR